MSKSFKEDLTGRRFGRWTVLEFVPTEDRHSHWQCKCDCGSIKTINGETLKNGHTKSCGCFRAERTKETKRTHCFSGTRLHKIWKNMRQRCNDPNSPSYKYYGGRGIKITSNWNDFKTFQDWAMLNGYNDTMSIERIDVNGNYEPANCKWIPLREQNRNTRANHFITFNRETKILADWARTTGINADTIYGRLKAGWSVEDALTKPVVKKKNK